MQRRALAIHRLLQRHDFGVKQAVFVAFLLLLVVVLSALPLSDLPYSARNDPEDPSFSFTSLVAGHSQF